MPVTFCVRSESASWSASKCLLLLAALATSALSCGSAHEPPSKHPSSKAAASEAPAEVLMPLTVLQRLRGTESERRACFGVSGEARDGFVKLAWDVGRDGKVSGVAVEGSSVHDRAIESCLSEEVAKLDYGPRE